MHRSGLLAIVVFLSSAAALAGDLIFSRNARTYETQQSSLMVKAMAHACLTMQSIPDGLPCNPAFTPQRGSANLQVEALLSNGFSTLDKMRKILNAQVDQDLANTLFSSDRVLQIEGNAELDFFSPHLNGQYTPASAKFLAVARDEANPTVDLYAVLQDGFVFQSGFELAKGLFFGAQVRHVDRKYVRQQFFLLELATDEGKQLLAPRTQGATYFEPAVSYIYPSSWQPRWTVMATNLGIHNGDFTQMREPTEVQTGIGISPPVGWGTLSFGLDYRSMNYDEVPNQRLHLGMIYHFGAMNLASGVDADGVSGGVYYAIDAINAGILYSTTNVPWRDNNFYTQTVYVELGWQN